MTYDEPIVSASRYLHKRDCENERQMKRGVYEHEMYAKKRKVLNEKSLRAASHFIFSVSATFFSLIYNYYLKEESTKQNFIIKSNPTNYHGFSNDRITIKSLESKSNNIDSSHFNFIKICNRKGLSLFFRENLASRYESINAGYLPEKK